MPQATFIQPDSIALSGPVTISDDPSGLPGGLTLSGSSPMTFGAGLLAALSRNMGTAPTLASNGTITPAGIVARVTTGGAVTGAIIANGTQNGQWLIVINESANTITMAAAATSHVASGTTNVIVANGGATYIWDDQASTPRWYCVGMGL